MKIIENLQNLDFFKEMSLQELNTIAKHTRLINHNKGKIIQSEGDTCKGISFILTGKARCYFTANTGKEYIVRNISQGDFFGEFSLIDIDQSPYSIDSITSLSTLFFDKKKFTRLFKDFPRVNQQLVKLVLSENALLYNHLYDLSLRSLRERLIKYISTRIEIAEKSRNKNNPTFYKLPTHQEISTSLGVARETISRELRKLEEEKIIEIQNKTVRFLNLPENY